MKARKGFTLIEIMIVVVIIGILAVALFPKLLGVLGKASDDARKIEVKNMATILMEYKNTNGVYPTSSGECLSPTSSIGTKLLDGYASKSKFPKDPSPNNSVFGCEGYFYYKSLSFGSVADNSFMLVAKMENKGKGNTDSSIQGISSAEEGENKLGSTTGDKLYFAELGM